MSIEDRYLSGLIAVQYPDAPVEPSLDGMQLAAGPSQTVSDAGGGVRVGRAGVPYKPPSMRDITEPAGAMLDMGAATLKGATQGFIGLPGDLENIGRMVLGAMGVQAGEKTVLPTTDEVKAWLDTNVGKVGNGQNPYESIGEVTAPGGQVKAVKAAGRGAKALAPKAGEMVIDSMNKLGSPVQLDLMAYHGTPHRVDRFDAAKIGTGEGNQSYGYGLYFAESPDVAKSYMALNPAVLPSPIRAFKGKELEPGSPEYHAATLLSRNGMTLQKARSDVKGWIAEGEQDPRMSNVVEGWKKTLETLNEAKSKSDFKELKNKGNFYTVDIADDMANKMLDFEGRIGDQSPEIQALAAKLNLSPDDLGGDLLAAARGKTAQGAQMMREAGIPGVRYLDQGSRGVGTGTRNIVVFPGGEDQIKILKHEGNK